MNIIIFGPPGSGKGTQAKKLAEKYNLIHVSTGDLLRANKVPVGTGDYVDDEMVIKLVADKIKDNPNGEFIFDGFPRTTKQALALSKLIKIDAAILLMVSDEEVINRIVKRGKTSKRADDNEEVAHKRIKEYADKTYPLKQFYSLNNILYPVNGEVSIEDVTTAVDKIYKTLNK